MAPGDPSYTAPIHNPEWVKFLDSNSSHVWGAVEDYWPRRLLHIPSMVSILRSGSSTYGDTVRPKYSILSYTWGRWQVRQPDVLTDGPETLHLPVEGVTWQIPIISEDHFTVDAFQRVVDQLGRLGETEWAWVDIACIDQENDLVKMDEVGRQASIFKNASKAFVWLSHTSASFLSEAFPAIFSYIDRLDFLHEDYESTAVQRNLEGLRDVLDGIFGDPWFSSLWTLQEYTLRPEARILDMNAECSRVSDEEYYGEPTTTVCDTENQGLSHLDRSMGDLAMILRTVTSELDNFAMMNGRFSEDPSRDAMKLSMAQDIIALIRSFGCGTDGPLQVTNPNVQYGAAKFRKTTRDEDRIYAISQIYNVRVGRAVRPEDHSQTLDGLVEEFGLAINTRSPLYGQLFIHTGSPPCRGRTWCITEDSEVPWHLVRVEPPVEVTSSIRQAVDGLGGVEIEGRCSSFWHLHEACLNAEKSFDAFFAHFSLCLDKHVRQLVDPERQLYEITSYLHLGEECTTYLTRLGPKENLVVMLLGTGAPVTTKGSWDLVGGLPLAPRSHYGVLLQEVEVVSESGSGMTSTRTKAYQRLGICRWQGPGLSNDSARSFDALLGWDAVLGELGSVMKQSQISRVTARRTVSQYGQEMERLFSKRCSVRFV